MSEIKSLRKGLNVLQIISNSPSGMGTTAIATQLGIDKASASRILKTLEAMEFIRKDPHSRNYILGSSSYSIRHSISIQKELKQIAQPFLEQLVKETGECAHVAVLCEFSALYIDKVDTQAVLRVHQESGTAPLHCTALGKTLMCFNHLRPIQPLEKFTVKTIIDTDQLVEHLKTVKKNGYSVDNEEYAEGIRCIAVPIFHKFQRIVSAIGISGPTKRITVSDVPRLAAIVMKSASELTQKLE